MQRIENHVSFWAGVKNRRFYRSTVRARPQLESVRVAVHKKYKHLGNVSLHGWAPANGWHTLKEEPDAN